MFDKKVRSYIESSTIYEEYKKNENKVFLKSFDGYMLANFLNLVAIDAKVFLITNSREKINSFINSYINFSNINLFTLKQNSRVLYSKLSNELIVNAIKTLKEISTLKKAITIVDIKTAITPLPNLASLKALKLRVGSSLDQRFLQDFLVDADYEASRSADYEGSFSIRGEVCDIFLFDSEYPVRIYLDFDKIKKISLFDPITQLSIKTINSISIDSTIKDESYAHLVDYISEEDIVVFLDYQSVLHAEFGLIKEANVLFKESSNNLDPPDIFLSNLKALENKGKKTIYLEEIYIENLPFLDFLKPQSYFSNFELFQTHLKDLKTKKYEIHILSETINQEKRIKTMLEDKDVKYSLSSLDQGFIIEEKKLAIICEREIFNRKKISYNRIKNVESASIDSFVDLNENDYVVHVNYGVGKFIKIQRIKTQTERDYIKIEYKNKEFIFVPIEQANLIQKYIGSKGDNPALDSISSNSWSKKKEQARKKAEDLAIYLTEIYAKRKSLKGFSFSKDTSWQKEFEANFEFIETDDQLKVIDEIKRDMESNKVSDRLICGDVGFGKTEIAFRAAFKAVMDSKQVAFLAPTTILAEQHYKNLYTRLGSFPVKIALLTRNTRAKKKLLKELKDGQIDIVIGTHRIIQKDVEYKNLGLFIVDEEQRFGVKDKERLKKIKYNIDSLALSATPIPRTLYMSLLNIRDMSLLKTPPLKRHSIETHIQEYNEDIIRYAIESEIKRGGQVFFLHNRIETIFSVRSKLIKMFPHLIIEVAHGQMSSSLLDDTMRTFINKGINILVSTTIIENGIDIPNVNTIIVDRADMYGTSQLYQLRGRVGRSDKIAHAYFLYPSDYALSDLAIKRLRVLSDNTSLGSGYKIAMKDMEIRGTGNLLGSEQSGQIASVGLQMYIKILDEEIKKLQNIEENLVEPFLDLDYTGFIDDSYISDEITKFKIYKRIASISTSIEFDNTVAHLVDQYGELPKNVESLLYIAKLKILCKKLYISHLKERNGEVKIVFFLLKKVPINKVLDLIKRNPEYISLNMSKPNEMYLKTDKISLEDKALFIVEKLQEIL